MNVIGLFEARARFSEICDHVASCGVPVTVTRRGRPLVTIEPMPTIPEGTSSVWDRREAFVRKHGKLTHRFTLPARETQTWRNPLAR